MSKIISNYRLNFLSILLFFIIAFVAFILTRDKFALNIEKLNTQITNFLATQEETRIKNIEDKFTNFKQRIIQFEKLGMTTAWLDEIYGKSLFHNPQEHTDHILVFKSKLYSHNPHIQSFDDLNNLAWYQNIIQADPTSEYIIKDSRICTFNQENVITMAARLASGTIIASIHHLSDDVNFLDGLNLPLNSSYFYYDDSGKLMHSIQNDKTKHSADNKLGDYLFDYLEKQNLASHAKGYKIINYHGTSYVTFYYKTENNWLSFICIDYKQITPTPWIFIAVLIVLSIYSIITYFSYLHEKKMALENKFKEETINFLGNMYFFIIRVNFLNNSFKIIKSTNEITNKIKNIYSYDMLISELALNIEKSACDEFKQFFSLGNIAKLLKQQQDEYSGDFKADFNHQEHWISARLILKNTLSKHEAIVCFRDIETEKQEQIAQINLLQATIEQAQKSEKSKQEFFAKMSHDMRTPLNAIMGNITLAKQLAKTSTDFISYLNKISISSEHLLELIDYILNVSRMENEKQQKLENVDLKQCISTCVEPFYAIAKTQDKIFKLSFDIKDHIVLSHAFAIKQLLNNIISNSFKYSAAKAKILVEVKQLSFENIAKYKIIIKDTGFGISKKFLDKIFVPYSREARFSSSKVKGTGLGMNIVKNIVSSLNGEIFIDSIEGKGTTVTLVFSLKVVKTKDIANETANNDQKDTKDTQQNVEFSALKFLIVDDSEMNLDILEQLLNVKKASAVYRACNGQEAVDIFNKSQLNEFNCILMDLQMPVMNGLEASKQIRSLNRKDAKSIPIIALTANAFAEDIIATNAAGMNSHIAKPINTNLLYSTILDLTQNKNSHD